VGARICLTGSFYSLEHPHTDVPLNLISAFRCVASNDLPEGVYVAFRTTAENKFASIIPASDLKPMQFDDVAFRGIYGLAAATYELHGQFKTNLRSSPIIRPWLGGKVPSKGKVRDASKRVAQIVAYPGLDLSPYASHVGLAALVVSLYHSGTASSQIPDGGLLEFLSKRPQVAVMLAAYPAQHLDRPYESTLRLIRAGALVYRDLQPHVLHVALALALAQGRHTEDVAKALSPWSYENSGKATHNSRSATDLARSIFS
jgi:L-asparaginase/Glu-tRNA(Gln) amidotransferase subunit D